MFNNLERKKLEAEAERCFTFFFHDELEFWNIFTHPDHLQGFCSSSSQHSTFPSYGFPRYLSAFVWCFPWARWCWNGWCHQHINVATYVDHYFVWSLMSVVMTSLQDGAILCNYLWHTQGHFKKCHFLQLPFGSFSKKNQNRIENPEYIQSKVFISESWTWGWMLAKCRCLSMFVQSGELRKWDC